MCDSRSLRTDAMIGEFKVHDYTTKIILLGNIDPVDFFGIYKNIEFCNFFSSWMWAPSTMSTVSSYGYVVIKEQLCKLIHMNCL